MPQTCAPIALIGARSGLGSELFDAAVASAGDCATAAIAVMKSDAIKRFKVFIILPRLCGDLTAELKDLPVIRARQNFDELVDPYDKRSSVPEIKWRTAQRGADYGVQQK